jgi:hypothetical protein
VLGDDPGDLVRQLLGSRIADEGIVLIESLAAGAPSSAAILALLHEMETVPSYYADDDLRVRIMLTRDPASKDLSRYSENKWSRH